MFHQLKNLLIVLTYAIVLLFALLNIREVFEGVLWLLGLFGPFLIGALIAFILNRPYNFFRHRVFRKLGDPQKKGVLGLRKTLSLLIVYLIFLAVIVLLIFAIVPQLLESVQKLVNNFDRYSIGFQNVLNHGLDWLDALGIREEVWRQVNQMWTDFTSTLGQFLANDVAPYLVNTLGGVATGVSNFVIGLVSSVYFLSGKEKLLAQAKRVLRAVLPVRVRRKMNRIWELSNQMFGEFIIGQIANAAIVGVLCFIGMSILRMDYALLISVVVCISNVIPFFGCIIGAIPSAFILLMVDPMQALWFIIFITLLQAVDGNIICPKIVGGSIGLSGLWVMASIVVGSSMLGVAGMFLGVPLCGVLYALMRDFTISREKKLAQRRAEGGYLPPEDVLPDDFAPEVLEALAEEQAAEASAQAEHNA